MGKAAFSQHQNKQEERYLMNAKAICRLVPAILAVCILLLVQSVSAEEPKHSVTLPKTANGYEAYSAPSLLHSPHIWMPSCHKLIISYS